MHGDRTRVDPRRIRRLQAGMPGRGSVIYWMSRDQRSNDNWALIFAQDIALASGRPLNVVFCLCDNFMRAPLRHYDFMLKGLRETALDLAKLNASFRLLKGAPSEALPPYLDIEEPAALVTDFSPLRIHLHWLNAVSTSASCPIYQVDAHNVIPSWEASDKREYAARTIRPKIQGKKQEFLTSFPKNPRHPHGRSTIDPVPSANELNLDRSVPPVTIKIPGPSEATRKMKLFLEERLASYEKDRNDPNIEGTSGLSPYIHFGHIAPQRLVYEALKADLPGSEAFVEESMVRRELAENFCLYETLYDRYEGMPRWGRETLDARRQDARPYLYGLTELEEGNTHDELWNCAQLSLLKTGKIHGYLRMYWGKMILLWSPSPEEAFARAIYLNDRYALDGRDPNGYAGIGWCIGGLHDRPWPGRPVFGSVRSMTLSGCARKFDVKRYLGIG